MGSLIGLSNAKFVGVKGGKRAFGVALKGGVRVFPAVRSETITINNNAFLNTPLVDFPIYIDLSTLSVEFWQTVGPNGGDIRVYLADGITPVPREVVSCVPNGGDGSSSGANASTGSRIGVSPTGGKGELWFKAPSLSNGAVFIIKCDGISAEPAVNSAYGARAVWTDYSVVSHDGGITDTLGNVPDLSAWITNPSGIPTTYTLKPNQFTVPVPEVGLLGAKSGAYFVANSDTGLRYVKTTKPVAQWSLWAKPDIIGNRVIVDYRQMNSDTQVTGVFGNGFTSSQNFAIQPGRNGFYNGVAVSGTMALSTNAWQYLVIQAGTVTPAPTDITLGQSTIDAIANYDGLLDEFRLCNVMRSPSWIAAEYMNQINPSGLYRTSGGTYSSSSYTATVTIDKTKVPADISDFPVFIDLAAMPSTFWSYARENGGNIRCYAGSSSGAELAREVVSCDVINKTGELYVKRGLSSVANTVITITVDRRNPDYAPTDPYGRNAVWSNGFVVVSHDGGMTDSTANGFNGTLVGIIGGRTNGKLGNTSQKYIGQGYIDVGNDPKLQLTNGTITAWFTEPAQQAGVSQNIAVKGSAYGLSIQGNDLIVYSWGSPVGTNRSNPGGNLGNGNWRHLAHTFQSGVTNGSALFIDAVNYLNFTMSVLNQSIGLSIGGSAPLDGSELNTALLDEVRIASAVRSAAWIAAEYANQNNPTTFYTITG